MKLPVLRPRQLIRALEKAGFLFVRQKGSHRIYIRGSVGLTVPVHSGDLKPGTLRQILKQADLSMEELVRLLEQ